MLIRKVTKIQETNTNESMALIILLDRFTNCSFRLFHWDKGERDNHREIPTTRSHGKFLVAVLEFPGCHLTHIKSRGIGSMEIVRMERDKGS